MHIYVGNLTLKVKDTDLKKAFSKYGKVDSANVYKNIYGGQYEAMGFVVMPKRNEALKAIAALDGKIFRNRKLIVHSSRKKMKGRRRKTASLSNEKRSGQDRRKRRNITDIKDLDLNGF